MPIARANNQIRQHQNQGAPTGAWVASITTGVALFSIGVGSMVYNIDRKRLGIGLASYFGGIGLGVLVVFSPCFFSWEKTQPKKPTEASLRNQLSGLHFLEDHIKTLSIAAQYGFRRLLDEAEPKLIASRNFKKNVKQAWEYAVAHDRDDVIVACLDKAYKHPLTVMNQWKDFSQPEAIRDAIVGGTLARWATTKPQGWVEPNEVQPSAPL